MYDEVPPTVRSVPVSEESVSRKLDRVIENQRLMFDELFVLQDDMRRIRATLPCMKTCELSLVQESAAG